MTKETTWRGSWRSSKGAKPSNKTPEQRAAELANFAAADARNVERRAARLAEPEPVYISPARLDAAEKALDAGMKAATGALEWKELIEEKGGTCLRNERHEDMSWELCGQPTTGTAMYCPRHMLDALGPPQAGNNPVVSVASTITPPTPKPFNPDDDPAIETGKHPRVGYLYPVKKKAVWERLPYLHTKKFEQPREPNPTLERERAGQEFPVRQISRTKHPLQICEVNASHGYHEGDVCGRCVAEEAKDLGLPGEVWPKCGHPRTEANTTPNGPLRTRCWTCKYGHAPI